MDFFPFLNFALVCTTSEFPRDRLISFFIFTLVTFDVNNLGDTKPDQKDPKMVQL